MSLYRRAGCRLRDRRQAADPRPAAVKGLPSASPWSWARKNEVEKVASVPQHKTNRQQINPPAPQIKRPGRRLAGGRALY